MLQAGRSQVRLLMLLNFSIDLNLPATLWPRVPGIIVGVKGGQAGSPDSSPDQVMWDLWWRKRHYEYLGFSCQAFHSHHHPSSSGAGTIGHLVASVKVDSVPLHPKKQKKKNWPECETVNFTAICEPIVWKIWDPQCLASL
jgi:hypothetical protein